MWAHNQWYEGTITQYDVIHGRHCVVYDDGEQKWYHMANKTFYVVHRQTNEGEEEEEGGGGRGGGGSNSRSGNAASRLFPEILAAENCDLGKIRRNTLCIHSSCFFVVACCVGCVGCCLGCVLVVSFSM